MKRLSEEELVGALASLQAKENKATPFENLASDIRGHIAALEADNARLREALREALDDVADWGSYASPYFQAKHDLQGDIDKYKAALAERQEGGGDDG